MDTTTSNPDVTEDNMTCHFCTREYRDPRVLCCLHTFCIDCLKGLLQESFIICPTCDVKTQVDDTESLPSNIFISSILKSRQFQSSCSEESRVCSNCDDEDLKAVCKECQFFLCAFCTQAHKKQKSTRHHEILTIEEFISSEPESSSVFVPLSCDKHEGELIKMFCSTCEEILCRDCVILNHREHSVLEMKSAYEEIKPEIQSLVHKIDDVRQMLENAIESVHQMENNVREAASNQTVKVNEVFEEISRVLVKRKKELMDSIIQEETSKLEILANQARGFRNDLDSMKYATDVSKETLERDNPFEILSTKKFMSSCLLKLIEEKRKFCLGENDDIVFRETNIEKALKLLSRIGEVKSIARPDGCVERMLRVVDLYTSECRQVFKISVFDKKGCPVSGGKISGEISVLVTERGVKGKSVGEIHDNQDGTYTVTYQVHHPGQYQVDIMSGVNHIMGSPFHFIFRQF